MLSREGKSPPVLLDIMRPDPVLRLPNPRGGAHSLLRPSTQRRLVRVLVVLIGPLFVGAIAVLPLVKVFL